MRQSVFEARARTRLSEGSARSYVTYLRRVEHLLGTDLDACPLDESALLNAANALRSKGMPAASVRNSLSAMRCYRELMG